MTDHLTDIASDLSVFHRISDPGEMDAPAFFALAVRLPAYRGVVRARLQAEQQENAGYTPGPARPAATARYEARSPRRNNPRTALSAPPATRQSLTALNTQLGQTWFQHRTVPGG